MRTQNVDITPPTVEDQRNPAIIDQSYLDMDTKKNEVAPDPHQDAFVNEEFAEIKYKVLKWWQCGLLMVAETVSLGVLSLPAAVAGLGLVPALIVLIGLGVLASYTGYVIGQFEWRYPHISNAADAGEVIMGRFGRGLLSMGQILFLVFSMASHLLTFRMVMNTMTWNMFNDIFDSFVSILAAVLVTMIGVVVQNPGVAAKATVDVDLIIGLLRYPILYFHMVVSHNTFFTMISELEDPRDFPKALALLQCIDASICHCCYAGADVASPAPGPASPLISKITCGIALRTIIGAGVINGHVAFKRAYLRIFAGTDRMHNRDWAAVSSWIGIGLGLWIVAWIIASAIPVFNNLLSLVVGYRPNWRTN
ncbi:hypothetical protein MW887_008362 [Aspergillus wentii]|nr:hypothetical protein MW887_008362 [Aspergillus wentii]